MKIYYEGTEERLDYLINEVLEDIFLWNKDYEVALVFKDGFVLEDYEHLNDLLLTKNEKAYKVKLIELLIMLYSFKTNTKIGSVFRAYRIINNLSQQKVSQKTEIPLRTYESWERGLRTPSPDGLFKVIRFLEIDVEYVEKAFEE